MNVGVGRLQTDVASPAGRAQARGVQRLWMLVCVGLLTAGAAGCERAVRGSPRSLSGSGLADADDLPTEAQPTLRRLKVWVGPKEVQAEVCLSAQEIRTGMMFRTNILDSEAMLFVFAHPHQAAFWMKNVPIPLACAYIDPQGTILEIHELQPHNTNSVVAGTDRVQFVLETAGGWFQRNQVRTGMVVHTERGSLQEAFSRGTRRP